MHGSLYLVVPALVLRYEVCPAARLTFEPDSGQVTEIDFWCVRCRYTLEAFSCIWAAASSRTCKIP